MIAKLIYNLPEDETEFKWARNGYEYWSELKDLQRELEELSGHCRFKHAEDVVEYLWDRFVANASIAIDV